MTKKILEYTDITNKYQARDLVILGAQIYQTDYADGIINVDIDSFKTFVLS